MTDQSSVEDRKAASAAGAGDNSAIGVDGDGASTADVEKEQAGQAEDAAAPGEGSPGGEGPAA